MSLTSTGGEPTSEMLFSSELALSNEARKMKWVERVDASDAR
jgi:hypothetical protein